MLFIAMWFFVAGFYPFPYLIAIGKPVDFRIMQPVLIATGAMMYSFYLYDVCMEKHPPPP